MRPLSRAFTLSVSLLLVLGALAPLDAALRDEITERYGVSASPGGVRLEPLEPRHGVRRIELAGAAIRVNGAPVTPLVLEAWVGADAVPLLQLAALSGAEQRQLFGLPPPTPAEEGEAEPAAPAEEGEAEPAAAEGTASGAAQEPSPPPLGPVPALPGGAPVPQPPEPPEPLERPSATHLYRTGSQFTLFDDLTVGADESARDAVAVFGSVHVEGEVRGDATAVFGSVWVDGRVEGEVVSVMGAGVTLGPQSEVMRGVTAVGGAVTRQEGAVVRGAVTEVPLSGVPNVDGDWRWGWRGPFWAQPSGFGSLWTLFWRLVGLAVLALLLCLTLLLAPRAVEGVTRRCVVDWWQAGLAGLLALVLYVPAVVLVCILLAVTIIGCALIPFVVVLAVFLPLVVVLVGYAGVALCLGRWLAARFEWRWSSPYPHLLVGFVVIEALRFVGGLALVAGGLATPIGWLVAAVGAVVRFVAVTIGVGALLLNRFGRPLVAPSLPPAAPPPTSPGTLPPLPAPPSGGADGPASTGTPPLA